MLLEHERHYESYYGGGMDSDDRVLLEHERYSGVGMDALMTVCSRNTNIIEVWAWMLK